MVTQIYCRCLNPRKDGETVLKMNWKGFWFWCVGFFCFYGRGLFGFEDEGRVQQEKVKLKSRNKRPQMDLNVAEETQKAWDPEKEFSEEVTSVHEENVCPTSLN